MALNEQRLVELGWCPVATIDGANFTTWRQVAQKVTQLGHGESVTDDWCNIPIVVKNQKLFRVDTTFLNNIKRIKTRLQFLLNVKKNYLTEKEAIYGPITSHDDVFTQTSAAYSFNLEELVKMKVPKALTVTKLDGIVAFGPWFTAGHIEAGGDDSITHVPIGRKLMVIAKRGNPARGLEALMTSVKSLVNLLTKPPPKRFGCDVKLFFTSPDSIMVQPALWAHTVITFGNGPSSHMNFAISIPIVTWNVTHC